MQEALFGKGLTTTVVHSQSTKTFTTESVGTHLEFWGFAKWSVECELGVCAQTTQGLVCFIAFHKALSKRKSDHSTDLPQPLRPVLTDARRPARRRSSSQQPRKRKDSPWPAFPAGPAQRARTWPRWGNRCTPCCCQCDSSPRTLLRT